MPFTPFHLGPAAAIKVVAKQHFSFLLFGFTQVVIDLEPLYYMLQKTTPLHRFFHTYLGATVVLLIGYFIGRPLCEYCMRLWNGVLNVAQARFLSLQPHITARAALLTSALGVYSHVLLDSIMHADMQPFAPFSEGNNLLHAITIMELHVYCAIAGIVGGMILLVVYIWDKWSIKV